MRHTLFLLLTLLAVHQLAAQPAWGDQGDGTYKNPFLFADYNNPDVCVVGEDFYMIAATHHFMGMPILHSRDLINWTLIGRVFDRLPFDARYYIPGLAYMHGAWAPNLSYHNGTFYMYCISPREGLFVCTATQPEGPWSEPKLMHKAIKWEDPFPYWDDDGNAYLMHGGKRDAPFTLHRMSADGMHLLDSGVVVIPGVHPKGPRILKRNGYYYVFAAEAGMTYGYQSVYRSKNIYGPYEKKKILEQGSTQINGARQGPWIALPDGSNWFLHFQVLDGYGRVLHLHPAHWNDDGWPVVGVDYDGNGVGEPVPGWKKPVVKKSYQITLPQSSDDFAEPNLGFQWRWNHNADTSKWSLRERAGHMRIYASMLTMATGRDPSGRLLPLDSSVIYAKNTLVQLVMGRNNQGTVKMDLSGMVDDQDAGLAMFNKNYHWIGVQRKQGKNYLAYATPDTLQMLRPLDAHQVYLRIEVTHNNGQPFTEVMYSENGDDFIKAGAAQPLDYNWFEGAKYALFTYNRENEGGYVDFDWFRYQHDGPKEQLIKLKRAQQ